MGVQAAKRADPVALEGEITFSRLMAPLIKHGGISRGDVMHIAMVRLKLDSPADAFRFHCSDLVTIRGPKSSRDGTFDKSIRAGDVDPVHLDVVERFIGDWVESRCRTGEPITPGFLRGGMRDHLQT